MGYDFNSLPEGAIALGENTWYVPTFMDNVWVGINEWHINNDGALCAGFVAFEAYECSEMWQVVSYEPLTLSPSLLCRACGHHGYIRNGGWVPC